METIHSVDGQFGSELVNSSDL